MKKNILMPALVAGLAMAMPASVQAQDSAAASIALPKPAAGMGQVVIFRPSGMGMAVKCTVRENGKMVSRVGNSRYDVIQVAPGTHTYTTKSESTDTISLLVEEGETSFAKCKISMGVMVGRPNLSPSTEDEFRSAMAKLKPMETEKLAAEMAKDEAALAAKAGK